MRRAVPVVLIALLAIVRHDLWWWDDPTRVFGLPVGLAYHVAFCVAVSAVMAIAVRTVRWTDRDDSAARGPRSEERERRT